MRFKSDPAGGFQVYAVSGTNTISFAISGDAQARRGLLGFAVERADPRENQRYIMPGYKVFRSVIPDPQPDARVSTWEHPVQSFLWDDFTAKPDREYEYIFYPLRGAPRNLDRRAAPIPIRVRSEKLYGDAAHDIFFNRGVASSQAYRNRFGNSKPDLLPEPRRKEALQWLSRDLDDALLAFIGQTRQGDGLLCCFYEFRYLPVAQALRSAIDRGVDARIIVDAKVNERTDDEGFHESFPRVANLQTIADAGIPDTSIVLRDRNPTNIQHNKFMVWLKGAARRPAEVWTGSTNISEGGIHGQTNVGHWLRDAAVAADFQRYWELLETNPGSDKGDTAADARKKKAAYRKDVAALTAVPASVEDIPQGVTPLFSPRSGLAALDLYVSLVDSAQVASAITLAFGINKHFKAFLQDNTPQSHIVFMLLEKEDKPNPRSQDPFIAINASNNVYRAWGSYFDEPVYQWARETNARILQLNQHVSYIHSKFLLMDPLGADPIVVTGSANFSEASTTDNDENMLIIRGSRRVADIYFTEFNRLFNHYYFRSVLESRDRAGLAPDAASLFLDETAEWQKKYARGKLRAKRLELYRKMQG